MKMHLYNYLAASAVCMFLQVHGEATCTNEVCRLNHQKELHGVSTLQQKEQPKKVLGTSLKEAGKEVAQNSLAQIAVKNQSSYQDQTGDKSLPTNQVTKNSTSNAEQVLGTSLKEAGKEVAQNNLAQIAVKSKSSYQVQTGERSLRMKQVMMNSTSNGVAMVTSSSDVNRTGWFIRRRKCSGRACCCEAKYGIVGGDDYQLELEGGGSFHVVSKKVRGVRIYTDDQVRDQCVTAMQPAIRDSVIDRDKPCVIYMAAFDWAKGGNYLEGTKGMQEIVGKNCDGCPKVTEWCGDKIAFPTMFWEVASFNWAQRIGNAPECGSTVYVLVPDIQKWKPSAISNKISFRIEISSLISQGKQPDFRLIFVGNTDCSAISNALCRVGEVKKILESFIYVGCVPKWEESRVALLHTARPEKITCAATSANRRRRFF